MKINYVPINRFILCALAVIAGLICTAPHVRADMESARAKGLAWLMTQQRGDGSWQAAPGLEVQSTAAALDAFTNAGIKSGYSFGAAVAWLQNADPPSVDSLARKIVALKGAGVNVTTDYNRLYSLKNRPDRATWGAYDRYDTSFPDTPLALSAVRISLGSMGYYLYAMYYNDLGNSVYCEILPAQRPADASPNNGSWSFMKPLPSAPASVSSGAILPTAHTILELLEIWWGWNAGGCGGANYSIVSAVTNGVNWLLTKKTADNGFGDNGQSSGLETALAYQVLVAVNSSDPARQNALNWMVNVLDASGNWQGDPFQTALVLKAFTPTTLQDTDGDGIPNAVETLLGTNPNVADGRDLIKGSGLSETGKTTSTLLASVLVDQTFSQTLTIGGGTAPYTWRIISGSLPDGLSLNAATGTISGTPTAPGTFSFTYEVTDVSGSSATGAEQIEITVLNCSTAPVKLASTGTTYATLQQAYAAATNNDTILMQATALIGSLDASRNISITLQGGHDCNYSAYSGNMTSIIGMLRTTAGAGTLTLSNIILKTPPPDIQPPTFQVASATGTIGNTVTVSGTAGDAGSGIQKVEISTDSGATWSLATGTADWSYTWNAPYRGTYTVWVKVTDNANNFAVSTDTFTPTISCSGQPAKIARTGTTYATIQAAYDTALNNDTIQVQALNLAENLIANRDISVTLEGGYTCDYGSYAGNTTWIWGTIQTTSGGGTLTIRNFVLKSE